MISKDIEVLLRQAKLQLDRTNIDDSMRDDICRTIDAFFDNLALPADSLITLEGAFENQNRLSGLVTWYASYFTFLRKEAENNVDSTEGVAYETAYRQIMAEEGKIPASTLNKLIQARVASNTAVTASRAKLACVTGLSEFFHSLVTKLTERERLLVEISTNRRRAMEQE